MMDEDIPIAAFETRRAFIPQLSQLRFFERVARKSGVENLVFSLGHDATIDSYGVFGQYVASSDSFIDALQITRDLMPYHSSHDRLSIDQDKNVLRLNYHAAVRNAEGYRHYATLAATVMLSIAKPFFGNGFRRAIEFNFAKPRKITPYEDHFGCDVFFDRPELSVVFDLEAAAQKRTNGIEKSVTLGDVARDAICPAPRDLVSATEAIVRASISSAVSIDQVAFRLDYSERTLRRRLEECGTNFRDIAQKVRIETAQELIFEGNLTIAEISKRVGYSTPSHFIRAFRQLNGLSPLQARAITGS
ncbi:AraC family transcriptional regulator [Sulfitobacter sp. SK012]|uniref:AraC family transcriptional regulator n=1 Tax=Sulfitobacter sp. SK012 TaxID=1389005 RepID=UPI0013B36302|nr:AraC family transcriptional regulator [Sulfitobacter sp. SK012]